MKLCYVCGFAWEPKGTVRARAYPLAEEMVRRGHEVTLVIAPYDNLHHSGQRFVSNGVRVTNLDINNDKLPTLAWIPRDLIKAVDQAAPDLVHVFKPKGFAGLAAMWLLKRSRDRVVLDCDDWEGWGGWNDVKRYPWLLKEFIALQEKWLLRRSETVTVASKVLQERAVSSGKQPERIFYVPNGPTPRQVGLSEKLLKVGPEVSKRKLGFPETPLVLYAGHFDPADDVMFFCKTAVRVASRRPLTIVFAGDGPELPSVRSFFNRVPDVHAHFLGRLPYEDYAEVVAAADVCAFPYPNNAVYRAKCSARIIDYMLFGKSVLSTSVGQNSEYIVSGASGLLTAPGDEAGFEKALDGLIADPELRARLGRNARARLLRNFLWSGMAGDNCEQAYHSLVSPQNLQSLSLSAL